MANLPELATDLLDFAPETFGNRKTFDGEPSVPGRRADMRESQKLKRLRFAFSSPRPIGHGKTAKFNQPRLPRVDLQPKLLHPRLQRLQKALRFFPVLEPQ